MATDRARKNEIRRLNEQFVGCSHCDKIFPRPTLMENQIARCDRCHSIVLRRRPAAAERTFAFMLASFFLYGLMIGLPFLKMEKSGFSNQMSLVDTAAILWKSHMFVLSVLVALFVIILPITRIVALLWVSARLYFKVDTRPVDRIAFRIAAEIDRWTMSEIFIIGVLVSLVKIMQMTETSVMSGLWAMSVMIIILTLGALSICPDTFWEKLRSGDDHASKA